MEVDKDKRIEWMRCHLECSNRPVTCTWPQDVAEKPTVQNPQHHDSTSKNTVQTLHQACEHYPQQEVSVCIALYCTPLHFPECKGKEVKKITLKVSSQRTVPRRLLDMSLFDEHSLYRQVSSCGLPSSICCCIQRLALNRNEVTF